MTTQPFSVHARSHEGHCTGSFSHCKHVWLSEFLKENPSMFKNVCVIKWLRCKQSHSEWFGAKCSILEKLSIKDIHSSLDRNQMSLMSLKAPSAWNGYKSSA